MSKKTIPLGTVLEKANNMLANSVPELVAERKAIASFVGDLLHKTGNYKGYGYLATESDLHAGIYGKDGRIFFYINDNLKEDYQTAQIERKNS